MIIELLALIIFFIVILSLVMLYLYNETNQEKTSENQYDDPLKNFDTNRIHNRIGNIKNIFERVEENISEIKNININIPLAKEINKIKNIIRDNFDNIINKIVNDLVKIAPLRNIINNTISQIFNTLINGIIDVFNKLGNEILKIFLTITKSVSEKVEELIKIFPRINADFTFITDKVNDIRSKINDLSNNIFGMIINEILSSNLFKTLLDIVGHSCTIASIIIYAPILLFVLFLSISIFIGIPGFILTFFIGLIKLII